MGFMNEYKRLDNLCRSFDDYPQGISSYINLMEKIPQLSYSDVYKRLKRYRYLRNQISHDNDVNEDDQTTVDDEQWLVVFRQKILKSEDPISLYYKRKSAIKPNNSANKASLNTKERDLCKNKRGKSIYDKIKDFILNILSK